MAKNSLSLFSDPATKEEEPIAPSGDVLVLGFFFVMLCGVAVLFMWKLGTKTGVGVGTVLAFGAYYSRFLFSQLKKRD